jgi:hypothetical protein
MESKTTGVSYAMAGKLGSINKWIQIETGLAGKRRSQMPTSEHCFSSG